MAGVLPSDELTDEPSDFGSLRPGTRLGRYVLLLPVARGGMARVWAARQQGQRGFQKLVAIKTILPHLAEEPEFERMFLDEARIASGVHHPNVCEIYELGEERRTLYLAMEWVSGDSLSRVLRASGRTEALDARVVCRILADACGGVHAAHELADEDGRQLGVVHRDLSPHNILLTLDGVAKVCDFGVAKALGQLHEQTSAGQLKGKISYMSPEQVMGQPVDRRSDVFSLGCVLYEATTGERPFRGENDFLVMQAIMKNEVVPPSSFLRGYSPDLERIVMRALAPQPILRYPTAERMRFALEELLTKGPLVTQSNVAQVVRARIGDMLDRRRERIRQASSQGDLSDPTGAWDAASVPRSEPRDQRSGVKPASPTTSRPPGVGAAPRGSGPASGPRSGPVPPPGPFVPKTLQMAAVTPRMGTPAVKVPPPPSTEEDVASASSSTLPNAPPVGLEVPADDEPPSLRTVAIPPSDPASVAMAIAAGPASLAPHPPPPSLRAPSSFFPDVAPAAPVAPVAPDWSPRAPVATLAPPDPPPESRMGYVLAALVGLLLAVVLGGGGFWLYNTRLRPHPAPPRPAAMDPTAPSIPGAGPTSAASNLGTVSPVPAAASTLGNGAAGAPVPVPAGTVLVFEAPAEAAPDAGAPAGPKAHRTRPGAKDRDKEPAKDPAGLPDNPY